MFASKIFMLSNMSTTATSAWPIRMCNCGHGACFVKRSGSVANPGRHYYKCTQKKPCRLWIGWCDEYVANMTQYNPANLTSLAHYGFGIIHNCTLKLTIHHFSSKNLKKSRLLQLRK